MDEFTLSDHPIKQWPSRWAWRNDRYAPLPDVDDYLQARLGEDLPPSFVAPVRARNVVALCVAPGSGPVTVLHQKDPLAISITFRTSTAAPAIIIDMRSSSNEVDGQQDVARVIIGKQQLRTSSSPPMSVFSTNIRAFFGEMTPQEQDRQRQHVRVAVERLSKFSNFETEWQQQMLLHGGLVKIELAEQPIPLRAKSTYQTPATEAFKMYLEQHGKKELYIFFDTRGLQGQNKSINALWTAAKLNRSFHGLSHTIQFCFYLEPAALDKSARKIVYNRFQHTKFLESKMSTQEAEGIIREMSLLQRFACRAMDDVFIPVPDFMLDKGFKQDDKNKTWESATAITEMSDGFTYRMMLILALHREKEAMRMRSLSSLKTSKTYPVALEPLSGLSGLSGLKGVLMASIQEEELDDNIWKRAIVTGTGSHVEVELLQHAPRSVRARYVGVRGQVAALPTPEVAQLRITLTHGAEDIDCTGDWAIKVSATSPLFVVDHQIECIAGLSKLLHPDAEKNTESLRDLLPFEHYLHGSCWYDDARFDLVEQHQLREADLRVTAAEEQKNGELFAIEDKEEGMWWWESQPLVPYATFQQQENVAQLVAKVEAILYPRLDADQQKAVAQGFWRGPQATVVSGPAGNGKSTVVGALAVLCAAAGIPLLS